MTQTQRAGLGMMLLVVFIIQIFNTPYLENRGWLIIVIIIAFNTALFFFVVDDKPKPQEPPF